MNTDEIMRRLENGVKDVFQSQKYMDYLKVMSKFHEYSVNNTLLIMMQKPDASLVAGYNAWKQMGRQVNNGEKGIRILAPVPYTRKVAKIKENSNGIDENEIIEMKMLTFKPVSVFDIGQTTGKKIPQLTSTLLGSTEKYQQLFDVIQKISDIPISFDKMNKSKGYCTKDKIVLNESNSDLQNIKTLIHELGHYRLHFSQESQSTSKQTKEVEAESIAYVVCQHFGIDTSEYSFGYIAGWSSDKEAKELKDSLDIIKKTASEMINEISELLKELEKGQILKQPERKSCLSKLKENQESIKNDVSEKMKHPMEVVR